MADGIGKKIKALMSSIGGLAFMILMFGGVDVITDVIFPGTVDDKNVDDSTLVENAVPTADEIREQISESSDNADRSAEVETRVPQYNHAPLMISLPFFIIAGALAVWFLRRK